LSVLEWNVFETSYLKKREGPKEEVVITLDKKFWE